MSGPRIEEKGQRALRGPNLYGPRRLWRLMFETDADASWVARRMAVVSENGQGNGKGKEKGKGKEDGIGIVDDRDMGRLVASLACSLQQAAGIPVEEYHALLEAPGAWVVAFAYEYEEAAQEAGRQAVALVRGVLEDGPLERAAWDKAVSLVGERHVREAPSRSVQGLLDAARRRGVPVMRREARHHQLGWGHKQQHLRDAVPGRLSSLGYDIADDHERVLEVLEGSGIPVAEGESCETLDRCREVVDRLGWPVTVKPLRGRGGLTVRLEEENALAQAFRRAKARHDWVYVQEHVPGIAHRVLVVGDAVVAVARRSDGVDVTRNIHPSVVLACRRTARLVGLDVVAVDLVGRDLQAPLAGSGTKVVSLHPSPSLEPFLARGAADRILEQMIGEGDARIPLVAVTGTNGKTTTVRLVSHILKYAGARVGMAVTGALEVENQVILRGDWSGPAAAQTVLREPGVTHAVCEVARGGILRSGLGFDACDVAVMLNVSRDHLGEGGIDTLEDLARLKSVVLRSTREQGKIVLNADDPLVWGLREEIPREVIPFTLDPSHPDVERHLREDPRHLAVTTRDGAIVVRRGDMALTGPELVDVPLTFGGAAVFNVQNAMAATAVAYALGLGEEDIRAGLVTFNPSMNQLPGRMNLFQVGQVKVLVDYGHNVAAVQALAPMIDRLAKGRRINVASGAGNRKDEDLRAFGRTIAKMYDRIYVTDADPRGRPPGETSIVIAQGVREGGLPEDATVIEHDEPKAFRLALAESRPGDLVVLQADDVEGALRLCRDLQARLQAGESPAQLQRDLLETGI